jgi:hypothetical protein
MTELILMMPHACNDVMMPHACNDEMMSDAGCMHMRGWGCCWGKKNCQLRSSMPTLLLFFSPLSIRYTAALLQPLIYQVHHVDLGSLV